MNPSLSALPRALCALMGLLIFSLGFAPAVSAQPSPPIETFDLVLYGDELRGVGEHVRLKSNPWRRDAWIAVGRQRHVACAEHPSVAVLPNLPTPEYLGQDVRENYVALKIVPMDGSPELRAAYALPSADTLKEDSCNRIVDLIASDPAVVRRHSLASHTRPRPVSLSGRRPFIEHLEAPIRHRKPGVMEVEWLEILFAPES